MAGRSGVSLTNCDSGSGTRHLASLTIALRIARQAVESHELRSADTCEQENRPFREDAAKHPIKQTYQI
jgi:hypothetical protein